MYGPNVERRGEVMVRRAQPWSGAVVVLLRHLEDSGFEGSPRVIGLEDGEERLSFIDGAIEHPGPMPSQTAVGVAALLRRLHEATASFDVPHDAVWQPWFGRDIGTPAVIGHCDAAPWNVVVRHDGSVALIDWEAAGPVDPIVDLAHACWLNANLYSDDVAEMNGMPPLEERAATLRAMVDAYGLTKPDREGFVRLMIDVAVYSIADDADEHAVTIETRESLATWGMAWRARSAAWMLRHREVLELALV